LFDKNSFKKNIGFLSKTGVEGISNWTKHFFWPIMIYLLFGEVLSVGSISSFLVLVSIMLTYIISFAKNKRTFLILSGIIGLFAFPAASFVQGLTGVLLLSVIFSLHGVLLSTPITLMFYKSERKYKDVVLWREVFLHAPIGLFAMVCSLLPANLVLQGMFLFGGLLNLFLLK
jgi:hypothetical protein